MAEELANDVYSEPQPSMHVHASTIRISRCDQGETIVKPTFAV